MTPRHKLRSFEEWERSLQNFDWLDGFVPGATDVDFLLHASVKGADDRYLLLEFKSPGAPLPMGQRILLTSLKKQGWTVVVIWGPDANDEFVLGWSWKGKVTREQLAARVEKWWKGAKRKAA